MKLVDRLLIGKDGILMSDMMTFPGTWEEFEKSYGFTDNEEVYTNGARLIPSFRVKQWLDHLPSIQQEQLDCEDCIKHGGDWGCDRVHCHKGDAISRQQAIDAIYKEWDGISYDGDGYHIASECEDILDNLPSVQPRKGKWTRHFDGNEWYWYCSSCKEQWYEEDLWMGGNSFPNFCPNCGSYNGGEKTNCGCRMEEGDAE